MKQVAICLAIALLVSALNNGLADTPQRAWNPYNAFSCDTTEAQYRQQAQLLVSTGLAGAGYNYFNLDCGWQGTTRSSTGQFTWNTTRFPSGIPALASFVHGLGLKFGVYSDGGYFSCDFVDGTAGWLGSLGHETSDAATWASWGADYLKYDNCYAVSPTDFVDDNPPIEEEPHFTAMRDALNATGRPILFSICEWGVQDPARWAPSVGNSWRISNDIGPPASWDNLIRIINQVVPITGFAGPGAWNDLDMLEVGNTGLTTDEQQTHFSFWSAAKSPLIVSTDLTKLSSTSLSLLVNKGLASIHQDSLGESASFKRRYTNDHDVWAGPLSDGSTVAVIINWKSATNKVAFSLADVGLSAATITNVVTGASLGHVSTTLSVSLPAHGSAVLKLSGGTAAAKPSFTTYLAASGKNTLANGATTRTVNSSTVVGDVGMGGTLTFNGVDGGTAGGTKLISVDYINADYTFSNTNCSNCRNAFVSVNNGTAVQVQFPISGQSWDILFSGYLVSLSGFKPGAVNTIQFGNPTAWAPDFLSIGVAR